MALLRICQECLANVRKHASATLVTADLTFGDRFVQLKVRDDGIGFNPKISKHDSFGLMTMRERAHLLGGTLEITSEEGKGTLIEAALPRVLERQSTLSHQNTRTGA